MQLVIEGGSNQILASLDKREAAVWLMLHDLSEAKGRDLVRFATLPWKLALVEGGTETFTSAVERVNDSLDSMVRRRGFIHLLDSDPSRLDLPPRCLPFYLLDGRRGSDVSGFAAKLRRMTMLEELRRSEVRNLVLFSPTAEAPVELQELWKEGFRASLTVISDAPDAGARISQWAKRFSGLSAVNYIRSSPESGTDTIVRRFDDEFPEDRQIVRIRNVNNSTSLLDVTELDDADRPIFGQYSIIQERNLAPLTPDDLSESDLIDFFQDSTISWKPYAAGLPWVRDSDAFKSIKGLLGKLNSIGASENTIAYISSEAGAGGTTLARAMAWACASDGYPTLIADQLPFVPDALSLSNFLNRAHAKVVTNVPVEVQQVSHSDERRYEVPWVAVFDIIHWRSRESELIKFRNELIKSGRPVLILVVTGPILPVAFYNYSVFKSVAELNHEISKKEAEELGRHLNRFLTRHGKARKVWEWERFYSEHSVHLNEGAAAFWLSLSFWIRGQYDMTESIQEWIYRCFKTNVSSDLMPAVLQIAALSSERVPMPEGLLPKPTGDWPVSHLLADSLRELSPLGLTSLKSQGKKYWALLHDLLGRFLINALFYDFTLRDELGYATAKSAEHLRFQLLRDISLNPTLGERDFRVVGEEFATSFFKIDPDHGRGSFAPHWREVLGALEQMPRSLRDSSRVFRHHVAVSRRRISKLNAPLFDVRVEDKVRLLSCAVDDLTFALERIVFTAGSESDLNLYNSLANAYLDLANAELEAGGNSERVSELRELANVATRKAFDESPNNSFVLETYVKNLLENARVPSSSSVQSCIEALGILFSALNSGASSYRRTQLSDLARNALELLLSNVPPESESGSISSPTEVLVEAWRALSANGAERDLSLVPESSRLRALDILGLPPGKGNLQVIHLTYDVIAVTEPMSFMRQLELIEQLVNSTSRVSPQLRLEYAILLYQCGRANEGDRRFRELRQLWRESEHLVHVPERLRWLFTQGANHLQTVNGVTGSDHGTRASARVREFANGSVPFRPEEFGLRDFRPGQQITGLVSFGHNGPFLRPTTTNVATHR